MSTFLPHAYSKGVAKEYRTRLLFVASSIACLVFSAAIVLSIPAFLTLRVRLSEAVPSTGTVPVDTDIESTVRGIQEKAAIVAGQAKAERVTSLLERTIAKRSHGIALSGFSLRRGAGAGALSLTGMADAREDLVLFVKSLESEPLFTKVNLPVSALAKGKDISFTLSIDATF